MIVISARIEAFIWEKLKKRLKTKTNQDTLIRVVMAYNKLWKENQDLQLKVSGYKQQIKKLKKV